MTMGEYSAHVKRLWIIISVNWSFISFCCSSDNECICWHVFEGICDLTHVDHAGHVRVTKHALCIIQWVSHLSLFTFYALVLPDLLEWVIRAEDWRCRSRLFLLLLLWSSLFGSNFRLLLRLTRCRNLLRSQGHVVGLDVFEYVRLLDVALGAWDGALWREYTIWAHPPACSWSHLEFWHFRCHWCIETSRGRRKLSEGESSYYLRRSLLVSREYSVIV